MLLSPFLPPLLAGQKTGEAVDCSQESRAAFLEGPERRSQNPHGGVSRGRSPPSRQRAGVFPARPARKNRRPKRRLTEEGQGRQREARRWF